MKCLTAELNQNSNKKLEFLESSREKTKGIENLLNETTAKNIPKPVNNKDIQVQKTLRTLSGLENIFMAIHYIQTQKYNIREF